MIKNSLFFLFLVLVFVTIHSVTVSCTPQEVVITLPPLPLKARLQPKMSVHSLAKIIDSLIDTSEFNNWTSVVSSIDSSIFPNTATLFVPDDGTLFSSTLPLVDPFMFAYHVVPHCLGFSDLRLFEAGSRLPTLIPDKYIIITSNSNANFTLDNSRLTLPDLYSINSIVVHGISTILDYKTYGDCPSLKPESRIPRKEPSVQMTKNTTVRINATGGTSSLPLPPREEMIGGEQLSCAACSCCKIKIKAFLVVAWFYMSGSCWFQDLG